jgi:hypothetical protein
MPLKLQILSTEGAKWQIFCEHRLVALSLHREFLNGTRTPESRVRVIRQNYELPNRVRATVISADICNIIRIEGGGIAGFIFHPCNSLFPGGFTSNGETIADAYGYPLVDDDHGSRLITGDAGAWSYDANPPENYGNMDWIGEDGTVVSWRGPASRSFPMDPLHSYPGFMIVDYVSEQTGESHYTPYQNIVYQGGEVLFEFPITSKVVGATNTHVILVVDYAGRTNPDNGVGGFFTEIWQGVGTRIGYRSGSRPSIPWLFNQQGNKAESTGQELFIVTDSEGNETVSFTTLDTGAGTQSRTVSIGSPEPWKLNRSGSWPLHYGYKSNDLLPLTLTMVESQSTARAGAAESTFADLPILFSGTPPTSITINGPEWYTPGAYTFTIEPPDASMCEGGLVVTYPTGCGMGVITASMGSVSASKSVRMPDGVWKLINTEIATCTGYDGCAPTTPCEYRSIPADNGCGYSWLTGSPNPFADDEAGIISESLRINSAWRWGAKYDTTSNLGYETIDFQRWVLLTRYTYEYWCTDLVKGW